jgi:hypothetical protein
LRAEWGGGGGGGRNDVFASSHCETPKTGLKPAKPNRGDCTEVGIKSLPGITLISKNKLHNIKKTIYDIKVLTLISE